MLSKSTKQSFWGGGGGGGGGGCCREMLFLVKTHSILCCDLFKFIRSFFSKLFPTYSDCQEANKHAVLPII